MTDQNDKTDENEAVDPENSGAPEQPEQAAENTAVQTGNDASQTGPEAEQDTAADASEETDTESESEAESETADEAEPDDAEDAGVEDSVAEQADGDSESNNDDEESDTNAPVEIPGLKQIIEGAILAADTPLNIDNMISLFVAEQPTRAQVRDALAEIESDFEDRGFELKQVASGYRFQVREKYGEWIGRLWQERPPRYTRALLETLALIAYKQPITRGDIEEIRGVAVSTNIIRTLLEREWIRVVGHRDVPGRPAIYATTKAFLDYFNLTSLDELPTLSEIKDLDRLNPELQLQEEELIEPRTLEFNPDEDTEAGDDEEDADLDEVTAQVNTIQENIRSLFVEDQELDEFEEMEDALDEAEAEAESRSEEDSTEPDAPQNDDSASDTPDEEDPENK